MSSINQLTARKNFGDPSHPPKTGLDYEFWFPTPEICKNPVTLSTIQKKNVGLLLE